MKKILSSIYLLSLLALASCGGSIGSNGSYSSLSVAEKFTQALNDYYSTSYSDGFVLVKEHGSEAYSYCVIYDELTSKYVAYNLEFYYPGMSINTYLSSSAAADIVGNLEPTSYGTYYSWDYDVHFEETTGTTKDLEKVGSFMQEHKINKIGQKISGDFGLSEERGIEIAKLANNWTQLKKKRSLTNADANYFSKKVIGVDLDSALSAFKKSGEGDKKDLNSLFEKAATINNSTPERITKIFNEIILK